MMAVAVAASPASAADGWQRAKLGGSPGSAPCIVNILVGEGCFEPLGEWVYVKDTYADNEPVGVVWSFSGPSSSYREGVIYVTEGSNAGWASVNKSFPEDGWFSWRVCNVDITDGSTSWCSGEETVPTGG
ncbi:hypothetical protein [Streptomyces prasinopilosus]|nr:hypothetical protein [Streptomyces prasinopilosus]